MSKQHTSPCHDCPWRRQALRGWTGSQDTPEDWVAIAMGEVQVECHRRHEHQCAGISIFRANVFKSPRYKQILVLTPNATVVFKTAAEFIAHHRPSGKCAADVWKETHEPSDGHPAAGV